MINLFEGSIAISLTQATILIKIQNGRQDLGTKSDLFTTLFVFEKTKCFTGLNKDK